jgi:deoxycytidylate deaminase
MDINRYFDATREVALNSEFYKAHIGCIAVYKGKIIAKGYNQSKTHPMQMKYNRYREMNYTCKNMLAKVHAEVKVLSQIKNMDIDFKKVKLFIYRARVDRPYSISRPCQACMKAIIDLGIKDIYYTTDNGYAHEIVLDK